MGKFNYKEAPENDPIRIEQVFAEKPGGGVVHVTEDMPATTPVSLAEDGTYMKTRRVEYTALGTGGISDGNKSYIEIDGETDLSAGDFVTYLGTQKAKRVTSVEGNKLILFDSALENGDCPKGTKVIVCEKRDEVEYQYEPAVQLNAPPVYITGNDLKAADGEYQPVRLINGANVRKETAVITEEQAEKMTGIHLV